MEILKGIKEFIEHAGLFLFLLLGPLAVFAPLVWLVCMVIVQTHENITSVNRNHSRHNH